MINVFISINQRSNRAYFPVGATSQMLAAQLRRYMLHLSVHKSQ